MTRPPLRLYSGPEAAEPTTEPVAEPTQVRVAMRDVVVALIDAAQNDRSWIQDFATEEISISEDLYEVIMAYQYFCRSAG